MTSRSPSETPAPLPLQPHDHDGPVFREPWEAQAFALTLKLHENGAFTWPEWTDALSGEIATAASNGDPDLGDTYYHHWLRALEALVVRKGLETVPKINNRVDEWRRAYLATPHGQPIELDAGRK